MAKREYSKFQQGVIQRYYENREQIDAGGFIFAVRQHQDLDLSPTVGRLRDLERCLYAIK